MNTTNIKILVEGSYQLEYNKPEDLGIKFNRTVDDLTDLSKRFGEFSYTFSLPKTKINNKAFEFANAKGRKGIFVGTTKTCRVYNNNRLLLDGIIELRGVSQDTYDCAFFSTFTQLIDLIGSKNLKDITSDILGVINNFSYETDLISHLNAGYTSSDDTVFQFPFTYYGTVFTPYSVLNGASNDFNGNSFNIPDNYTQNWYYIFGSDSATETNKAYIHQFPMGIYIVSIMQAIMDDLGWTLGGSFFEREEIKKILMLYTGDNDTYDRAIGCPDSMLTQCSGISDNLVIKTFLPDMAQTDFISGLMNMFNLYFTLDLDNKIIKFETYDNMFGDSYNPYDITNKVFSDTAKFSRIDNYDPSILFEDVDNQRVLGDNKVMIDSEDLANNTTYDVTDDSYTSKVFNKIGTTSEIKLPFGMPVIGRKYLRNDLTNSGSDQSAGDFQIFLPILTNQTPNDNNNQGFYSSTGDTSVNNTEDTISFNGKPTLMYYYGQSLSDYRKIVGHDNAEFYYLGIGSSPTRTKIGFASPFDLLQGNKLDNINTYLGDSPVAKSVDTAEISYLKGLFYNLGKQAGDINNIPDYSLTFNDSDYHDTLWTKFHKSKYDLYTNSEMLEADMRMSDYDWSEMQINRPIKYNDELYSIISIDNYDPVLNTASIKLIKK